MKPALTVLTSMFLAPLAMPAAVPVTNSIGMKLVRIEPGTNLRWIEQRLPAPKK